MRVILTGASGYVGKLLAGALEKRGHQCMAWSRRRCEGSWHPYALGDDPEKLPFHGMDVLIHAAHDFLPKTWEEMLDKNVRPSVDLFRAASAAGVRKLVFISSISAYPGCRSNYGKAKLQIEEEVIKLGGMVIRPGLVWGNAAGGVMGALEKVAAKLSIIPYLTGPGNIAQYMVCGDDLAQYVALACENFTPGNLVSATHPKRVPMLQILREICQRRKVRRIFFPVHWRVVHVGLRFLEACGITPPFRSDSLIGLIYANPNLAPLAQGEGVVFRPYEFVEAS